MAFDAYNRTRVKIDTASGSQVALIAAQGAGVKIRVCQMQFIVASAVTVKFQSANTDLTGAMSFAANGGMVLPFDEWGWYATAANEAFNLTLGSGIQISGALLYITHT